MNKLPEDVMYNNKETFIKILKEALVNRENVNMEGLIRKLEKSDFFYAPASTRYHGSYEGGLCDHCLNVYYNAMSIAKNKHLLAIHKQVPIKDEHGNDTEEFEDKIIEGFIEADSIAIVCLLHDFSKMNYYQKTYRNKKVYCDSGSKKDSGGRFDWVSIEGFETIPSEERFLYGSHEETAEYMVRQFIPITYEESTAILHHHFAMSFDSIKDTNTVANLYNRYTLAALVHVADTISAFIDEKY